MKDTRCMHCQHFGPIVAQRPLVGKCAAGMHFERCILGMEPSCDRFVHNGEPVLDLHKGNLPQNTGPRLTPRESFDCDDEVGDWGPEKRIPATAAHYARGGARW